MSLCKETTQLLVLGDGFLQVAQHNRAYPAPANVVADRFSQQTGDTLVGLFGKILQGFPFALFDFGTDLDTGHSETISSDFLTGTLCFDKSPARSSTASRRFSSSGVAGDIGSRCSLVGIMPSFLIMYLIGIGFVAKNTDWLTSSRRW